MDWFYEMNNYLFFWEILGFLEMSWMKLWNDGCCNILFFFKKRGKEKEKMIIKGYVLFYFLFNKCIFINCLYLKFGNYIL